MINSKSADVIVLDDEIEIGNILVEQLRKFDLQAVAVSTTDQFLAKIDTDASSLVFLDLSLGTTDAIEVLNMLKARAFAGSVILMSGNFSAALEAVERIGQRNGIMIAGAIRKPFRRSDIKTALAALTVHSRHPPLRHNRALPDPSLLAYALENNCLEFSYQPQVCLQDGSICGVESLARIRHPDEGVLSAGPYFENADPDIHIEVFRRALNDVLRSAKSAPPVSFSINVSGCVLGRPKLREALESVSAPRPEIVLEITETDMIDDVEAAEVFTVRAMLQGYRISIDDFGAGYSTFERLRNIPVNEIKLDRSMVHGCADTPSLLKICRATVKLAHDFGAVVVAEGVERIEDLEMIQKLGFDRVQGYIFSRPVPFDDIAWFRKFAVRRQ